MYMIIRLGRVLTGLVHSHTFKWPTKDPRSQICSQRSKQRYIVTTWRLKSPGVLGEMVNTDKHHVATPRLYDLGDAPLHNLTCTTLKPREAQLRSRARRVNIRVSIQIKYIPFYCISSLLISIRRPRDFSIGPDVATSCSCLPSGQGVPVPVCRYRFSPGW